MSGFVIYLILIIFVILRTVNSGKSKGAGKQGSPAGRNTSAGKGGTSSTARTRKGTGWGPLASDGHRVPKDQDISCRRFGHQHEEFDTPRFIPHDDPEEGYIILNGVKMKRGEADRYEDRI